MSHVKFNHQSAFYADLKNRVNQYFTEHKIDQHGDARLHVKAGLLLSVFVAVYVLLVFFTPTALWSVLLCVLLGLATAGIGFNIMHDGSHGSFSNSKTVNRFAALTLNLLGGSAFFWNIKHNMVHHTYTNIDGHDDDIQNEPFLRMCATQRKRKMHKYQHLYWFLIYGFMYISWVFLLDFQKYFSRHVGAKDHIQIDLKTHIGFWLTKILYVFTFIILPLMFVSTLQLVIGYLVFSFTTGIVISVVFQLAHAVEHVEFIEDKKEDMVLENDWAVHQMFTTANFATKNKIVAFFTGGLNHQIEHHLFPKISHIYYPELSKIVRKVSAEYGINYVEQPTVIQAIASHVRFLKRMGR
ncbi:MAG: acyl-CoA desaturase [Bacteroidetes bacterium]|nr:acyl-CoA desaturase [Bacteroidota bacterium]